MIIELLLSDVHGQAQQANQLAGNVQGVRHLFEFFASELQQTPFGSRAYGSVLGSLERASTLPAAMSYEYRARSITDALVRVLTYYPKQSGDLFMGYTPTFYHPQVDSNGLYLFDRSARLEIAFAESNLESYARYFEPMILFTQNLRAQMKTLPQEYRELYGLAEVEGVLTFIPLRGPTSYTPYF